MVSLRKFMLTAAAVMPTASGGWTRPVAATPVPEAGERLRIGLAGEWGRYVAGALYDRNPFPSSQRPLDFYSLRRDFVLPHLSARQRAILHFDATTYYLNPAHLVEAESHRRRVIAGIERSRTISG